MDYFDLLYDYDDALQRLNRNQYEINSLRKLIESCDTIPQTITDKQMSKLNDLEDHTMIRS